MMPMYRNRALVVEDDRSWQEILAEILEDSGLIVDTASNMEGAAQILGAESHRLAVVDLSLGGSDHHNRDGLRVLDMLRNQDPNCQAILLTGFATVELAVDVINEYGALTCLRKEAFQRSEFIQLVRRVLAKAPPPELSGFNKQKNVLETASIDGTPIKNQPAQEQKSPSLGTALVVEDDAGWRNILQELLIDVGLRVRACSSYGEGLGCLRREKFTLAVVDLALAGPLKLSPVALNEGSGNKKLEGYRLLTSTRAGGVPTIVVSGVATPVEIERAYAEQGIFAFLQKQVFNRQAFLQTVQDALAVSRDNPLLAQLTVREREVLNLLAQGLTNKEIAETLVISTNTVKRHLKAIFGKLDIHTRSAAAAKAVLVPLPRD